MSTLSMTHLFCHPWYSLGLTWSWCGFHSLVVLLRCSGTGGWAPGTGDGIGIIGGLPTGGLLGGVAQPCCHHMVDGAGWVGVMVAGGASWLEVLVGGPGSCLQVLVAVPGSWMEGLLAGRASWLGVLCGCTGCGTPWNFAQGGIGNTCGCVGAGYAWACPGIGSTTEHLLGLLGSDRGGALEEDGSSLTSRRSCQNLNIMCALVILKRWT